MDTNFDFGEIGLTTRDKRVYEALYLNPGSSLRKIADETNINRGSVYESIKQLTTAGLVGSVQTGKRQQFIAQDPQLIVELLSERRQAATNAERLAGKYIANLARHVPEQASTPSFAVYYEGDEGIAAILRDVLKTMRVSDDKHYYVISSKRIRAYMYHNFHNYTQQRIKSNIRVSVIAVGEGGEQDFLANRVWMPDNEGDTNCYTIMYDTKTAFISISDENILSGIVIDNEGVTNLQKLQFSRLRDELTAK
jgi:sugar-specific transcriptional regulator TrmB